MNYDFDILPFTTDNFQTKYEGLLSRFGITEQARGFTALFRDPAVTRAIKGASPEVRDCFIRSGFGVTSYDSGAGEHRFPQTHTALRELAVERLRRNIASIPDDASWNGFDIDAFFEAAEAAEPTANCAAHFSVIRTPELATNRPVATAIRVTSRALSAPAPSF